MASPDSRDTLTKPQSNTIHSKTLHSKSARRIYLLGGVLFDQWSGHDGAGVPFNKVHDVRNHKHKIVLRFFNKL